MTKQKTIQRTLRLPLALSHSLDQRAKRLGVSYSATIALILCGTVPPLQVDPGPEAEAAQGHQHQPPRISDQGGPL